jgi:carboxyl-terminal processing protease
MDNGEIKDTAPIIATPAPLPVSKSHKSLLGVIGFWVVLILMAGSAGFGYLAGRSSNPGSDESFAPFWQAWDIVHTQYIDQPVDNTKLIQGAINGMMQSLGDEHSTYMDPATYQSANAVMEGYEGIGADVDVSGTLIKIIAPLPGSPAEQAGLKAGDEIIAIDGEDVTNMKTEVARQKILGPAGTSLTCVSTFFQTTPGI